MDAQLRVGKRAIRIQRVKEPLLLTLCTATGSAVDGAEIENGDDNSSYALWKKPTAKLELGPNMVMDTELYEGIVSQPIIEPKVSPPPGFPSTVRSLPTGRRTGSVLC